MEVTTKELRMQPGRFLAYAGGGQEVSVTYRGKIIAKIVPPDDIHGSALDDSNSEIFGLWKDRGDIDDVDVYVRDIRKGRAFDN